MTSEEIREKNAKDLQRAWKEFLKRQEAKKNGKKDG